MEIFNKVRKSFGENIDFVFLIFIYYVTRFAWSVIIFFSPFFQWLFLGFGWLVEYGMEWLADVEGHIFAFTIQITSIESALFK